MEQLLYSWTFSDTKNRGSLWYIITLSIVIGLAIWWFLTKQYGMSFIVLFLAGLYYFVENNADENVEVKVTELGIKIWTSFYDYTKISSYWFMYEWENALVLRLNLNSRGLKNIDLFVNNDIVSQLKEILPDFLEEQPKSDFSITDRIIKLLKL